MQLCNAERGTNFHVFMNLFCTCGWVMELTANSVAYCDNPVCPLRARAYMVAVKLSELEAVA